MFCTFAISGTKENQLFSNFTHLRYLNRDKTYKPKLGFNHKRFIFVAMDFESLVKHVSTIQNTLQAQAAHAVNLALTSRNWLMGCYIVEFEQNGEDRAAYGEQLLKKLEQRLNTKGLNERRFREFRRLYLVYPQLKGPIAQYITSEIQIRQSLTAEFTEPIRRLATAESENGVWKLSAEHPQTETWISMKWKRFVAAGLSKNWNDK